MSEEETVHFRVTGKQIGLTVAALATIIISGPVANWASPNVRSDAFTGTDGAALEDRVVFIEMQLSKCRKRNGAHREDQASELATIKANIKNNNFLIRRCMQMTGTP